MKKLTNLKEISIQRNFLHKYLNESKLFQIVVYRLEN